MEKLAVLDEIMRRIVEVAAPEKIILFGSAARGDMGPNSDVDLLVVKSGAHRRRLTQAIYMSLLGVGQAVDVVVVTPEDIERFKDSFALVIEPALREGKVIYLCPEPVILSEYKQAVAVAEDVLRWAEAIVAG